MDRYDVIVAGLGAMGSAALDHLSGRGVRVLGIEPFGVPHGLGSSGGDTRLIRKAYFEHPDYVPLLERAYHNWQGLESDTGESLLHTTGILYLGQPQSELVSGSRRAAAAHGLTLETLDAATLARDFANFRCPEDHVALLEPDAGFLLCERAIRAQVERAMARGAALVTGERVMEWRARPDSVQVVTETGRYEAGALVLAAGAWSGPLLADLELPLTVTRQPQFWLYPRHPEVFALGNSPCWAVQPPGEPGLFYGMPLLPGTMAPQLGMKLAHHAPGETTHPDEPPRPARLAELDALRGALAPYVAGLEGPMTGSRVCMYTLSADGHFLVDVHPAHPRVVFACGFSGHGFKFAAVLGEALADLALNGRSELPIGFLGLR